MAEFLIGIFGFMQFDHFFAPHFCAFEHVGFIDRAHIECSHAGQWSDRALLAEIPPSIEIVAGIADVKREPQSVSELSDRIAALLEVVDEDRLLLSTSCGCGRVPHDEAIRLLRNLVKAAGGE